jgi:hypothetical protein
MLQLKLGHRAEDCGLADSPSKQPAPRRFADIKQHNPFLIKGKELVSKPTGFWNKLKRLKFRNCSAAA